MKKRRTRRVPLCGGRKASAFHDKQTSRNREVRPFVGLLTDMSRRRRASAHPSPSQPLASDLLSQKKNVLHAYSTAAGKPAPCPGFSPGSLVQRNKLACLRRGRASATKVGAVCGFQWVHHNTGQRGCQFLLSPSFPVFSKLFRQAAPPMRCRLPE